MCFFMYVLYNKVEKNHSITIRPRLILVKRMFIIVCMKEIHVVFSVRTKVYL